MQEQMPVAEHDIGVVTHYWNHLGVAGVHLNEPVDVGDHLHFRGHMSDFEQDVASMQIDHHNVLHANAGEDVGIRVGGHAHAHDHVYKLEMEDVGEGEGAI